MRKPLPLQWKLRCPLIAAVPARTMILFQMLHQKLLRIRLSLARLAEASTRHTHVMNTVARALLQRKRSRQGEIEQRRARSPSTRRRELQPQFQDTGLHLRDRPHRLIHRQIRFWIHLPSRRQITRRGKRRSTARPTPRSNMNRAMLMHHQPKVVNQALMPLKVMSSQQNQDLMLLLLMWTLDSHDFMNVLRTLQNYSSYISNTII